jgi:hypothetical protein
MKGRTMPTPTARKSDAANAKRSFTWGVHVSEVRWMKPSGVGPAIDGSVTASDCQTILPANPRRRRKPSAEAA